MAGLCSDGSYPLSLLRRAAVGSVSLRRPRPLVRASMKGEAWCRGAEPAERPAPRLDRRNLSTCTHTIRPIERLDEYRSAKGGNRSTGTRPRKVPRKRASQRRPPSPEVFGDPTLALPPCRCWLFAQARSTGRSPSANRPGGAPTPQVPDHRGQPGRIGGWKPRLSGFCPRPRAIVRRRVA